jgi:alpha-1,6-mannosyltransferase
MSWGGRRLPVRRRTLADALRALQPDIVEAADTSLLAWAALDAADALQIPALAFCHFDFELLASNYIGGRLGSAAARTARRYARRLYDRFDLVLAPSDAMHRRLLDWGVEHVARQPLGLDVQTFHPARANTMWRHHLGLPAAARLLVFAGRFTPGKHLQVLADTVQRLGAPYVLLAIGDGPMPPRGDRVIVRPFMHDPLALAGVLASADAFVHAGDREIFGLSVLEAMACGTPVVARATEGLAELVDDSVGATVRDGRADSFAQALANLFAHERTEASRRARERAESYDWNQVLPLLLMHYRQLLREGTHSRHGAGIAPQRTASLPS